MFLAKCRSTVATVIMLVFLLLLLLLLLTREVSNQLNFQIVTVFFQVEHLRVQKRGDLQD
jgi:hypothetical protein